ncbi:MAG: aminopeptidase P family protein, partial [Verrucomicrobiota bacterium]
QNSSLYYLTGVDQEETCLLLFPGQAAAVQAHLFVRKTADRLRSWEGNKLTKEQASEVSGIPLVSWTDDLDPMLRRALRQVRYVFMEANEHPRSATPVSSRSDRFRLCLQRFSPHLEFRRLAPILTMSREIKSEGEISVIQTACEITKAGLERVLSFTCPGVHEFEIEAEFLHEILRRRSRGFAYQPIIASGGNACALHYIDNHAACQDGDLVLMDLAAEYAGYKSDLTRTIPVNGKYTPRQRSIYESVLRVFRACVSDLLRPGITTKAYHAEVGKMMEEELLSLGLLDPGEVREERAKDGTDEEIQEERRLYRKYFMHGTSHSLGIDVHDVQDPDRVVKEGMVMTIEPGIYLPEENLGIRLENDVVVRASGNDDLMASIPIHPDEIEEAMRR